MALRVSGRPILNSTATVIYGQSKVGSDRSYSRAVSKLLLLLLAFASGSAAPAA